MSVSPAASQPSPFLPSNEAVNRRYTANAPSDKAKDESLTANFGAHNDKNKGGNVDAKG